MKYPRCPHCKNYLVKLYVTKDIQVGLFCKNCSAYIIKGHEIKDKVYAGLKEITIETPFPNLPINYDNGV